MYVSVPQMIAYQYGNTSNTISNASVFDIPSYCMSERTKRVCAPDQVEMETIGKIAQVSGGKPVVLGLRGTISSDYQKKIEAAHYEIWYDGKQTKSSSITDYAKVLTTERICLLYFVFTMLWFVKVFAKIIHPTV